MKTLLTRVGCTLVLVLMVQGASAADDQATSVDEQALTLLKRSADFIAESRSISLAVEYGFDVMQASGQKVEFGGTRKIMARRPDRARIEFARRDGTEGELVFDGKQVILVNNNENLYSIANRSGDVGTVLDFVADKLGVPIPLRDFLAPDPATVLTQGLVAARYGGEATIAGVPVTTWRSVRMPWTTRSGSAGASNRCHGGWSLPTGKLRRSPSSGRSL